MLVRLRTLMNGCAVGVLLAAGAGVRGQALPAAPQNCVDANKAAAECKPATVPSTPPKSAAQAFPFPGEAPSSAEKPGDVPDAPADATAPDTQPKQPRVTPPAYPGDPDTGASSSSSSSSSSSGGGGVGDDPAADDAGPMTDAGSSGDSTTPGHSRRRKMPKVEAETPESRVAEDLKVADFYQNDGNYMAAYLRAKDAVALQPEYADTHFALAQAAFKLGKKDEARAEFMQVLKLDPVPKQQKASQRALEELGAAK